MVDSKEILTLLGINSEKIASVDYVAKENGVSHLMISLKNDQHFCENCGSTNIVVHGYYHTNINNSVIRASNTYVDVEMRRYKCKDCGKTFKQNFDFYMPYRKISRAVEICIKDDLKSAIPFRYLAKKYNLSTNTIINIFDSMPRQSRLPLTSIICVDEFHFSNQGNPKLKYPFVISEPFEGKILDIIESRKTDYLWSYFVKLTLLERSKVKFFVSDMNETYRNLKKAFFPDATHIIDHFHVAKLFNNAVQKVRTKIMKRQEYESKEYRFLKKNWKMFVVNRSRLKTFKKVTKRNGIVLDWELEVDKVLRKYNDLFLVYQAREDFINRMLHEKYWMETKQSIDYFIQRFGHSEIPELQEIAKTFSNWYTEIINSYAKNTMNMCISNAIAEANNDNIQTLIDISYGYGNFERLRNRVLYINRNK